ncbi:MAG TPA: hypothetical protein VI229_00375 [Burkholderiales bacterium]
MSTQVPFLVLSLIASGDLSTKQFKGVKIDTNGEVAVAGLGEMCIGVLQNKPDARGREASVAVFGVSKMVVGTAGVTRGLPVGVDANGDAINGEKGQVDTDGNAQSNLALLGSNMIGIALETGVDNDIVPVALLHMGMVPTTAE